MKYKDPAKNRRLQRQVEQQGDTFTKACLCGCGDPTPLGYAGPLLYVNRTHRAWDYAYGPQNDILIADFRTAVRKLMAAKDMSVRQMAVAGGLQPEGLNPYLYNDKHKSVSKAWATKFFQRVAGIPAPPSLYQLGQNAKAKSTDRAIAEIGVDAERSTYEPPSLFWRPNLTRARKQARLDKAMSQ